jgi:hypothetical protein
VRPSIAPGRRRMDSVARKPVRRSPERFRRRAQPMCRHLGRPTRRAARDQGAGKDKKRCDYE